MIEFHEIEFKYDASNISLETFDKAVKALGPYDKQTPSGWDYYFTNRSKVVRFRAGELNEITVKKQKNKKNNFVRQEINLSITPSDNPTDTLHKVTQFLKLQGYKQDFSIHKDSTIYYFDRFDVVFYVVKNFDGKVIGNFIEIEMDEHHEWTSVNAAYKELVNIERALKTLGLKSLKRLNKSLFQMFHKKERK